MTFVLIHLIRGFDKLIWCTVSSLFGPDGAVNYNLLSLTSLTLC